MEKNDNNCYDLTADEIRLLCGAYTDDERIKAGKLYNYQCDGLNRLRSAVSYLKEKYPGIEFHFEKFVPAEILCEYDDVIFGVKGKEEEKYEARVTDASGEIRVTDDYYKRLIEPAYDREIIKYFAQETDYSCLAYTDFYDLKGYEVDGEASAADVIDMKKDMSRHTFIFVERKGSDEASYVSTVKKVCKDKGLYGSYVIYFIEDIQDLNMSAYKLSQNIKAIEKNRMNKYSFNIFDVD